MSRNIEVELVAAISTENPLGGAIIVASDGTHDSDGAVRVGMALGRRDHVNAALMSVVEPIRFTEEHDGSTPADTERMTRLAIEAREGELAAQRQRTHPGRRSWPFAIHVGNRVDEIVTYARRNGASLIVLGLGSHGVIARLLQRETALRVSRAASVPVLAVPPDAWGVPHSVLAAIDFTESSEDAARAAVELLGDEGTLYLAHVTPRVPIPQGDSRVWGVVPAGEILGKLEAVARRLDLPEGIQVEFVSLHGEPGQELVAFAEQHRVDLIATGAHGRGALGRLVLGSVSTKVVRTAQSWVLVSPARVPLKNDVAVEQAVSFEPDAQPIG